MEYINSKVFKYYSITFNDIVGGGLKTLTGNNWQGLKTATGNFLLHFPLPFRIWGGSIKYF